MTKRPLIIIGASGHGRVLADIAKLVGYEEVCFLDDDLTKENVIDRSTNIHTYIKTHDIFVGIGNNAVRERFLKDLKTAHAQIVNLIHPNSVIAPNVVLGKGIAVMAGAVINNGSILKDGVIVNTCSSIDHDCQIEECVHISVGAHLAGTVNVGKCTMIGAGATVINNISICEGCIIGAAGAVVKNIEEKGTYVGVPVRKIQ